MSQNTDSFDEESPIESTYSRSRKHSYSNRGNLSDSSKEDNHKDRPYKRKRLSTTGTSSQSSSAVSGDSDDSTSEMEDVAPPSMSGPKFGQSRDEIPMSNVSNIAKKIMMKTMGYKEGTGLGKKSQGIVDPIEASNQRGKRGLGFISISQGRKYEGPDWTPEMETISPEEEYNIHWMEESKDDLDRDKLESWMVLEPKKLTIDDEIHFCDSELLLDILSLKTCLDPMTPDALKKARSQCNPYEKIAGVFFINRAAMKMANMDAVFDYMFTDPKDEHGNKMVGPNDLLYFADVCAGPGGFTEYVLWRKKWRAKGFGFTLRKSNDFNLTEMRAASTSTFCPYYGVKKDGDIYDPANLSSLKNFVLKYSDGLGVHFLMGDGGFAVEGQENIQEILSKQLYLCQCVAALSCVRTGGNFVVKLFDLFTEFSVGLIYLMYKSFRRVCIHKPNTSRPANSERYLICKGKRPSADIVEGHLLHVNTLLWDCTNRKTNDVTKLVPLSIIKGDKKFFNYICDSNNRIGAVQKMNLLKVITYHKNPSVVVDTKHTEVRKKCLHLWNIPDRVRTERLTSDSKVLMDSIEKTIMDYSPKVTNELIVKMLNRNGTVLKTPDDIKRIIKSPYDWNFVFKGSSNYNSGESSYFYLGSPGNKSWKFEGKWIADLTVNLPSDTLVLAEIVQEYRGSGRATFMTKGFHILDAICLGGECVFDKSLKERYDKIALFCAALNKPSEQELHVENPPMPLRCKKLYKLVDLPDAIGSLHQRKVKNSQSKDTTAVPNVFDNSDLYYVVHNILLLKIVKDPWTICYSKNNQMTFYHNQSTLESVYDDPGTAFNSLRTILERIDLPYMDESQKNALKRHINKSEPFCSQ